MIWENNFRERIRWKRYGVQMMSCVVKLLLLRTVELIHNVHIPWTISPPKVVTALLTFPTSVLHCEDDRLDR
jgi:hypothetical protein